MTDLCSLNNKKESIDSSVHIFYLINNSLRGDEVYRLILDFIRHPIILSRYLSPMSFLV